MQQILKEQRRVLTVASLTEFAERYSYYMIQSLLIFVLIKRFGLSESMSDSLVGTVLSMVYISAVLGGYVAEKLIGYYRSGLLGSIFMVFGTLILAMSDSKDIMFLGLSFVSVSTGLIKSNMTSFIGRFYDKSKLSDGYRDFGFNIFYVGINLGGFSALILSSYLRDHYGYSAPFYSCLAVSLFMLFSMSVGFFFIRKYVIDVKLTTKIVIKTALIIFTYILILFVVLKNPVIANISTLVAFLFGVSILYISLKHTTLRRVVVASIYFVLSIIYWSLYFQIFISLLLFVGYAVQHDFLSMTLEPSQFLGVVSLGVLFFGFFMGKFWLFLSNRGMAAEDIDKFGLGFILLILSFGILYLSIYLSPANTQVYAFGFIIGYLILALSDLSLSAIGLSLMTKIAPEGFVSLYMSVWLVTLGIGGKIGGMMSTYIYLPKDDLPLMKADMDHGLIMFLIVALVSVFLCAIFRRFIIKTNI